MSPARRRLAFENALRNGFQSAALPALRGRVVLRVALERIIADQAVGPEVRHPYLKIESIRALAGSTESFGDLQPVRRLPEHRQLFSVHLDACYVFHISEIHKHALARSGAETGHALRGFIKERLEMLVADYEFLLERKEKLEKFMAEAIIENDKMLALMQLPGFYYHAAFVVTAIVEDAKRFSSAAKLTAYAGLSPMVNTSGEEEQKAMLKGGPGKPLDGEGRMDLKFYCCEAGQTVLNLCSKSDIGKWGWRMINRGKPKNKVCCAIGRKLITYAWHILRGDPTPNREGEDVFKRKMLRFYSVLGKQRMIELGYSTRADFASSMGARFYGHLPESIKAKE